jgi:glycosyltransferase involved in cell wall biosynthesis
MGNIGSSQGLAPLVEAYEDSEAVRERAIPLTITGSGVAVEDVRSRVQSDRVQLLGLVDDERLEEELRGASIGLVSQQYDGAEFNTPSKLMNFMAYGVPVLAAVNPHGEVARIVRESEGGWVIDSSEPQHFPAKVAELADSADEVAHRGERARAYADRHFSRSGFSEKFSQSLEATVRASGR